MKIIKHGKTPENPWLTTTFTCWNCQCSWKFEESDFLPNNNHPTTPGTFPCPECKANNNLYAQMIGKPSSKPQKPGDVWMRYEDLPPSNPTSYSHTATTSELDENPMRPSFSSASKPTQPTLDADKKYEYDLEMTWQTALAHRYVTEDEEAEWKANYRKIVPQEPVPFVSSPYRDLMREP